ncbi:hypothetical protein C7H19_00910 [Aphanothece hegewaldii CCALA 016]|uniref:Tubulin like n=1 Tax=Aphanothece hegewaldii CCALA 016 TaxID=2107694 RepID=A0A2T1M3H6_9CHRO|nr:tubulin-like doman-containing protein [Aphanothece hegewaldii]PSF39378.1 hypothetical protein C7H19_00910 [Aphanothece hegewaldii CCALA 016]
MVTEFQGKPKERQSRVIKKTICIGLGGTGRDVLMRIRRLIIDKYGSLDELPVISFLAIDTDKDALQTTGLRTGNTYQGEEIVFTDSERIAATMTPVDVNTFRQELKDQYKYNRPGPCHHIARWFPPQLVEHIKAIQDGAHGIRPVGRLTFFHNFRKIQKAIESAENRTRGHEGVLLKKGFNVEQGLNIFVVGSLCGGTGSGMFLDVAYTIRRMYSEKETQLFGYLVVSPQLYGDTPNMNGNVYAALKELNYYSTPQTTFDTCFDLQNLIEIQESRPPFDFTYLVSNQTAKDYKIIDKNKLTNVIAHKITLDFCGELASALKEQRDNFRLQMLSADEHPFKMTQRYLTFGLASVYFTRDIIVQVALNRLELNLTKFWLDGKGQSPEAQTLLKRFLINWSADKSSKDYFLLKLEELTQDTNKNFAQTLKTWKVNLDISLEESKNLDEIEGIINQLPGKLREQFRTVQPGETESTRGIWLTYLQKSRVSLIDKLKGDIEQYWESLLNPGNADFCVNNTRAWLEAFFTELNDSQRRLEEQKQDLREMYRLEDLEKKWQDTKQLIDDFQQQKSLPFFGKNKVGQIQSEARNGVQQIYQLIKHNFDFALVEEALKICISLQQQIQSLINQTNNLNNLFQDLNVFYQKNESDLKQVNFDEMSGEAILPEEDIDSCYDDFVEVNEPYAQLVSVSLKIIERFGNNQTLTQLLKPNLVDEPHLKQIINNTVDRQFSNRGMSKVQSAIKRFLEHYPISERSKRLEQILLESEPLLPINVSATRYFDDPGKTLKIIGFKDKDEPEVRQFKEILKKEIGVADSVLKPMQAEDEIIIVHEYAAFPLRIVSGLEQMRQLYERQLKLAQSFLHNDYSIDFFEMIPPDANHVNQIEHTFFPCIALDILKHNAQIDKFELTYYDQFRRTEEAIFLSSVWREAVEQLAKRQDIAQALIEKFEQFKYQLKSQPNQWYTYYFPEKIVKFIAHIDTLPKEHFNYFDRGKVIGEKATDKELAKDGIIQLFCLEMRNFLGVMEPQLTPSTNQTNSQPILTGEVLEPEIEDNVQSTAVSQKSSLEQLEKLKLLDKYTDDFKQGFLTQEQFEAVKKLIFDQ